MITTENMPGSSEPDKPESPKETAPSTQPSEETVVSAQEAIDSAEEMFAERELQKASRIVLPPYVEPAYTGPTIPVESKGGDGLGKCVRTAVLPPRRRYGVAEVVITYQPHKNYTIRFVNGQAEVPQIIADFIARENPGGITLA